MLGQTIHEHLEYSYNESEYFYVLQNRTNNALESYNKKMNQTFLGTKPRIFFLKYAMTSIKISLGSKVFYVRLRWSLCIINQHASTKYQLSTLIMYILESPTRRIRYVRPEPVRVKEVRRYRI